MVLFNAGGNPNTLQIGGQELAVACHNVLQRAVFVMPGLNVPYVAGAITPNQIMSHRPSYINALLIQSRGTPSATPCTECSRRGSGPFLACVKLHGHFGGACGSCKWRDHAVRCRSPSPSESSSDSEDDGDSSGSSSDVFEDAQESLNNGGKSGGNAGGNARSGSDGLVVRHPHIRVVI